MAQILKKAAKYRRVTEALCEGEAHLRDAYTPPPQLFKPVPRETRLPDDITNFPPQQKVLLPESIPYPEGKYRPASIPYVAGYYPYNMYQGSEIYEIYSWCSCGISQSGPWCDSLCNSTVTRNRPIVFNVNESGYYKMCNCKNSANAPFCNGTHRCFYIPYCRDVMRYYHKTHRGMVEIWGYLAFMGTTGFILWNWYQ